MTNLPSVEDFDNGFIGVNSRLSPHLLPSGYVANAVNRIFDANRITNRWGILEPKWGGVWGENVKGGVYGSGGYQDMTIGMTSIQRSPPSSTPHLAGRQITADVSWKFGTTPTANLVFASGTRVVSDDGTTLTITPGTLMLTNGTIFQGGVSTSTYNSTVGFSNIVGLISYTDAASQTEGVLIAVNEPRDDGGNGKIFFIVPSTAPIEISLNGYDFYNDVKMVQSGESVVLFRGSNARYYFKGSAGSSSVTFLTQVTSPNRTTFSVTNHQLKTGDLVYSAVTIGSGAGTTITANTPYYVTYSDANAFYISSDPANLSTTYISGITVLPVFQRYFLFLNTLADMASGDFVQVNSIGNAPALWSLKSVTTTAITTTDTFTSNAHGFVVNNPVTVTVAGTSGLTVGIVYYIKTSTTNTFQLSLTVGGALITGIVGAVWTFSATSGGNGVFVNVQGNRVSFYQSKSQALSSTSPLKLNSSATLSANRYYIELQKNGSPTAQLAMENDWENDANPIMMKPVDASISGSPLAQGFKAVPSSNYISAYDADLDTITVSNHGFVAGEKVIIENSTGLALFNGFDNDNALDDLAIPDNSTFYVYPVDANTLKLHKSRTGTDDTTDSLFFSSRALGVKSTYLNSVTVLKSGNGYTSPPAIRETNAGTTLTNLSYLKTATTTAIATANTFTSNAHGFVLNDVVSTTVSGGTGLTVGNFYYIKYVDANTFQLSLTAGGAAITGITGAVWTFSTTYLTAVVTEGGVESVTVNNGTAPSTFVFEMPNSLVDVQAATGTIGGSIRKFGAHRQKIPAGRDAIYFQNRLIILFGPDNLAVSDILDPLHYSPILSEFKLNTSVTDKVQAIYPFNQTTLLVFKERSILAIQNITGDLTAVTLNEITREFGCIAPLSITSTGSDVIFLSQRGVISLKQTEFGISQSVVLPLSDQIQPIIDTIDKSNVEKSVGVYFDNRYLLSFPVYGNTTATRGQNTRTIVFNFLTKSWEGYWESDMLIPKYWGKINIAGKTYLSWADSSGFVRYFDKDSTVDRSNTGVVKHIQTSVTFRGYIAKTLDHKQWTNMAIEVSTLNPSYTLEAQFDGVNEIQNLTTVPETKSNLKYYTYGTPDYVESNVNNDFLNPYREDYSVIAKTGNSRLQLGTLGVKLKRHQSFVHKAKLKRHSSSIQPKLVSTQGNVDVLSCVVAGVPFRLSGKIDS